MKRTFILLAAATLALAACTKENSCESAINGTITKNLTVGSELWNGTKSAYTEGVGIALTGSEKITVYGNVYDGSENLHTSNVFSATAATPASGNYTFTHPTVDDATGYNYFFLFPHKGSNQRSGSPSVPSFRLFPVQYPEANSFDPFCDIMLGKPAVNVAKTSTVEVNEWMRLGAPVKMTIKDEANLLEGEPISIASIYFPGATKPLAAMMTAKYSENYADVTVTTSALTKSYGLSAVYPDGCAKNGSAYNTWFVSLPVDFDASQEVDLTVTTTKKTLKFKTTLASALGFQKNKLNGLTFALTAGKQVDTTENSIVTCFTNRTGSLGTSYSSTDGTSRIWGFSSCNLKTNEADGRSYLRTTGTEGTITLPSLNGKYYTSIRVYPGENLWATASVVANLSLRSNGTEIQSKSFSYFKSDLCEKGYVEFTGITEDQTNLSVAMTYSNGSAHENLIGAIAANYTDVTSGGGSGASEEIDYLTKYNNNEDIVIGDLTVNKTAYGDAVVVTPSSLTYAILQAGGVVIIDDKTGESINPDSVAKNAAKGIATGSKELILIGRWGNIGKQTEIMVPDWRMNKNDATFFNVKLTSHGASLQMFAKDSGNKTTNSVRIVNCFLNQGTTTSTNTTIAIFNCTNTCTSSKGYGYFKNLYLENNIIRLTNTTSKNPVIFSHGTNNAGNFAESQLYTLKNCVVYCDTQMLGRVGYFSTASGNYDNKNLELVCENNTFYNLATGDAYIMSYNLKGVSFIKNVGHLDYSNWNGTKPYSSKIWYMTGSSVAGTFTLSDNKFYRENNPGNGVWVIKHPSSKTDFTGSNNIIVDGNPFKTINTTAGYLPLSDALAGYGATYTDKTFITVE